MPGLGYSIGISLGTQIPSIQGLMLPTFTYVIGIWGGDLKSSHWKVLEKVMKMHMMSHVEVHFSKTYHILLAEFEGCPI